MKKEIVLRVLPCSSKNEVVGEMENGVLKVKVSAAPVGGKANKIVIELLAKYFKVPKKNIKIIKGANKKNKVIFIN